MSAANTIAGQSVSRFLVLVLSRPALLGRGLKLLRVIWTDFFWPQYRTRLWKPPGRVVPVQHELDERLPFNPASLEEYLSFVSLWMRTRAYLYAVHASGDVSSRRGSKNKTAPVGGSSNGQGSVPFGNTAAPRNTFEAAEEALCDFLNEMNVLYRETGNLYKVLQSTTPRPSVIKHPSFWWMYLVDPHYHCLPSLHVIIVCFNFLKMPEPGSAEARRERDYAYRQALRITETVLEVKQHSLNCVAASLFFLTARPGGMDREQAETFVGRLFESLLHPGKYTSGKTSPHSGTLTRAADGSGKKGVTAANVSALRGAILDRYRSWLGEWEARPERSATDILLDYLRERGRDE